MIIENLKVKVILISSLTCSKCPHQIVGFLGCKCSLLWTDSVILICEIINHVK